jgi:hypothetical protein
VKRRTVRKLSHVFVTVTLGLGCVALLVSHLWPFGVITRHAHCDLYTGYAGIGFHSSRRPAYLEDMWLKGARVRLIRGAWRLRNPMPWYPLVIWEGRSQRFSAAVPIWMILVPLAILEGVIMWKGRSRVRLCSECGYNLTANSSGICPECGAPCVHDQDIVTAAKPR